MEEIVKKAKKISISTIIIIFLSFITTIHIFIHVYPRIFNNTTEQIDYLKQKYTDNRLIITSDNEYIVVTDKYEIYYCGIGLFDTLLPCERFSNRKGIIFVHNDIRRKHYINDTKNR